MAKPGMRIVGVLVGIAAACSCAAIAQEATKEVFNAIAVNMGGGPTGANTRIQVTVDKWSSEGQRRALLNILKDEGHDALMDALHEMGQTGQGRALGVRAGRANPFPSTPFQAAFQFEQNGQREIVMVAERPISAGEAASASMSLDYDTTVIIMQFPANDENAKGKGLLYWALKIRYDEENDRLAVEQMGREPVRLTEITKIE